MTVIAITSFLFFGLSVAVVVAFFLDVPLAEKHTHGPRGLARQKACGSTLFRVFEPVLRLLASHISNLALGARRKKIEESIIAAGEYHGLGPNELIAMSVLSSLAGLAAGYFFLVSTDSVLIPLVCCVLGPMLPSMQLKGLAKERRKAVDRGLPIAIDLAALCMGAGLDFPGSVQHVVENMPDRGTPIRQELERILQELSLGRTRQQALRGFAERVDTESVNEFVASVILAEEKGTPLSTVLAIQATALRGRRSVLAEEAAARAGVMLMLPMLMMMISICLILMGPLFIDMMKGGLM